MEIYVLTSLLLLGMTFRSSKGNSCIADHKCDCYKAEDSSEYKFQCPPSKFDVVIQSVPDTYIWIACYNNLIDYKLDTFPDFNAGNVDHVLIRFCPLPNENFRAILQKFKITNLKKLILEESSQQINSPMRIVSRELFDGLSSLEKLSLSSFYHNFSVNALQDLSNITLLYLVENNMVDIGYMFDHNPKLKVLDLSLNDIKDIPDGVFRNLLELQQLHLWGNKLTRLKTTYFTGLKRLKSLELSKNVINSIDNDTFSELRNLVNISLRSNQLSRINYDTFKYNVMLERIIIGNNPNLTLPDYAFANLPKLKYIYLEGSKLKNIPENVFSGSENLTNIFMQNNEISELSENVFSSLKKMKELDLSMNQLTSLPDRIFYFLKNLEKLNLEVNKLSEVNENIFKKLSSLKYLNLERNHISTISMDAFSQQYKLIELNLSHNLYNTSYSSEGQNHFTKCEDLQFLNLSHNLISSVPILYKINLKLLDLSYNKIENVTASSLVHISSSSVEVDLTNNNILMVDFSEIIQIAKYQDVSPAIVHMSSNSFICDCRNFNLIRFIRDDSELYRIKASVDIRIGDSTCARPEDFKHMSINKVLPEQITCEISREYCPEKCRCLLRPHDRAIVIDCAHRNLTEFPKLNTNYVRIEINLEGNLIENGPDPELGYATVRNMFLSNNKIRKLNWIPPNIEILKLDGNQLRSIDTNVLKALNKSENFTQLTLFNNPWSCGCSSGDLQNFLRAKYQQVVPTDVICQEDNVALTDKEVCKSRVILIVQTVVPILVFFLLTAVAAALYLRYKQEIKVWLYAKQLCLWLVTEEELDRDKKYDIFLSYSHEDEDFVLHNLLPILESGPTAFKVCIHVRDWTGGELITTHVEESVANSRRTLVVLSNNFMKSVWGKLEFRTAHTQALADGRVRLIVVKYGELDEDKIEEDFKTYLKTNTYVEWGEPWFWNKLNYALPHSKRSNYYQSNQKHANIMLKIDDKFEITSQPVRSKCLHPGLSLDIGLLEDHPLHFHPSSNIQTPLAEDSLLTNR